MGILNDYIASLEQQRREAKVKQELELVDLAKLAEEVTVLAKELAAISPRYADQLEQWDEPSNLKISIGELPSFGSQRARHEHIVVDCDTGEWYVTRTIGSSSYSRSLNDGHSLDKCLLSFDGEHSLAAGVKRIRAAFFKKLDELERSKDSYD